MIAFLLAPENLPFTVALAVMFVIALMEGTSLALGAGIISVFDNLIPSIDLDGLDAPDLSNTTGMTKFLGWLRIGQVPVLVTLVIFLTVFGLVGLILQSMVAGISGGLLPGAVAAVPALLVSVPALRVCHAVVARIIPKDETYAVSEETFIGRIATVTTGTATSQRAAQARLRDQHGRDHYVMIKPDNPEESFSAGASVLIVARHGTVFHAIQNPNPHLIDKKT